MGTSRIGAPAPATDPDRPALPPMRRDAEDNRRRILRAAHECFRERGLDLPMAAVARRSGVGTATLYRRFPTKDALVMELFADSAAQYEKVFDAALAHADPWSGMEYALRRCSILQVEGRVCSPEFAARFPSHAERHAREGREKLAAVLDRARGAGVVRAGITTDDVEMLFEAVGGLAASAEPHRRAQRLVSHLLASFAA
ncbi:helix-turn-helix domain-containing protein [Nocardiopsis tropica]|uniref:Helix-turn-helix domain-containing protein n=1 Tax=Nocardiopsis tropica TaxID=109330 RepID=A0ABU7KPT8_9ACTN|nr:helix-turn-helix domain-containing protein [Nocardiopsis umidischolae]MEE2051315.1 helix-turn-helix domain-containing protein [Nocardiopsis umidischolae]